MMMAMLAAGGMRVLDDKHRTPDDDNPGGYFEDQRATTIDRNAAWLSEAMNAAVKLISFHLYHVPPRFPCKIIFMERPMPEILASQNAMLQRAGGKQSTDDPQLQRLYTNHLQHVKGWLAEQKHMDVLYMNHGDVIADPNASAGRIRDHLKRPLDREKMAGAVNPDGHRQKS